MIAISVSVCIVISIMILLMFLVLKRTVKMVNESSKKYFINTIKEYDELIDKKNEKLAELNNSIEEISEKTLESKEYIKKENEYIDLKIPSYIDETFFENYKKVNESFNIDKEKAIKGFIQNYVTENDEEQHQKYVSLQSKLDFETTYKIMSMKKEEINEYIKQKFNEEEIKIYEEYKKQYKDQDISKFKTYLDELIDKTSPIIYIKVGNKYENFDKINPNIKTIYDEKVYTGMIIIYKSKIYDYSLGWR